MSTLLRVLAFFCGLLLLLPGLCTVLFGGAFSVAPGGGALIFGLPLLIVGGLLVWAGWAVLAAVFKSRD